MPAALVYLRRQLFKVPVGQRIEHLSRPMMVTFRYSLYSLLLHATVVLVVFLYCRSGERQRILPSDYLVITAVNMASEDFENNNATSSSATHHAVPAVTNIGKRPPQPIERVPEAPPRKKIVKHRIAARQHKIERKREIVREVAMAGTITKHESTVGPMPDADEVVRPEPYGRSESQRTDIISNKPNDSIAGAAVAATKRKSSYLNMNYEYIREIVIRNLTFPASARKRRISGKIEVSFLIEKDGRVGDIRVDSSSGHVLLDRKVVGAIRRSAPFPAPPEEARIALPIVFRLK